MAIYTSVRNVDCSKPVILSFDVPNDKITFELSLIDANTKSKSITINIKTNQNTGTFTEIVENSINNSTSHEHNTFQGEQVIIEQEESLSGIISNGILIDNKRPAVESNDKGFITFENNLSNLTNGSLIFFLTDNPTSDNVIHSNLGTFEQKDKDAYQITPFILSESNSNPIVFDITDDSLSFILLGNEVTKSYSKSPTTIYTTTNDSQVSNQYQGTKEILKSPYRCRFVISNNGRMLSFSKYNKESNKWENVKSFIFNIEKITTPQKLQINTTSNLTNISANF